PPTSGPGVRLLWPLSGSERPDRIDAPFGPRRLVSRDLRYEFHTGIDPAAPRGTPAFAAAAGQVRLLTDAIGRPIASPPGGAAAGGRRAAGPALGRRLQLAHGRGLSTVYGPLDSLAECLAPGRYVPAGLELGAVGHSGDAGYDHLHFEVRQGSFVRESARNPV